MNICAILLFLSPQERLVFFRSFLGSFWVGSCFCGIILWGNTRPSSEFQTLDQEQAITCVNSRMLVSTKWDQKTSTPNAFVKSLGNWIAMIGCGSSEAKDKIKLVDYNWINARTSFCCLSLSCFFCSYCGPKIEINKTLQKKCMRTCLV